MSLNYQEIIDNLDSEKVIKLMEKLGIDSYIERDNYIQFPTICHNIDSVEASMKLYWYKNTKLFVCYTECGTMSAFNFLKRVYELRDIPYDWYRDIFCVLANITDTNLDNGFAPAAYKSQKDKYKRRNQNIELPTYSKTILSIFADELPEEWLLEGITEETMEKYDIKYSISQNKIIIPHYNVSGELIGIRGRALNEEEIENIGKYMPVKLENKWYSHPLSLNLYGLDLTKENINKTGKVIVFEAEKSCMKMDSYYSVNNSVAVCGSNLHKTQLDILLKNTKAREVIIAFDKEYEVPNSVEGNKYFNKLKAICDKYKQYYNFSFIYDREGLIGLKDSPIDRGKDVFEELLKKRVVVK